MTKSSDRIAELQEKIRERHAREHEELTYFRDIWRDLQKQGLVSTNCICGRVFDCLRNLHCPACGSLGIMATRKLSEQRNWPALNPEGSFIKIIAMGYRCRRCSHGFTDMDVFQICEAPAPQVPMKELRLHDKANDALKEAGIDGVEDFKRKLEAYRKKKPN